jgi:dimethylamine--corrinoid protein Co-methyltransferase
MAVTHAIASGMGGMRTAGDLVARMQMARAMRIDEAKAYVADKLGISTFELADPIIMSEIREELNLGLVTPLPKRAGWMEAKFRIGEVLGIDINSVKRFKEKAGI